MAKDDDGAKPNNESSYYIEKGGFDRFRIDGRTGRIIVDLNVKFDRETIPMYNLTVIAIDRGSPSLTGESTVIVIIDDVNDDPPKFNETKFIGNVYENDRMGVIVANCSAYDQDTNPNLFYKIIGVKAEKNGRNINETVKDYFTIMNDTGAVIVNSNMVDRETTDEVTLILSVTDLNAAVNSTQTATATLVITIKDVNDNPPYFPKPYFVDIMEGKIGGTVITVLAEDADQYKNITYTISVNYNNTFSISSKTGIITRNNENDVDREKTPNITIIVEANDTLYSNTTEVIMTVLDVNDNRPTFQDLKPLCDVCECADVGSIVMTLNATDLDIGENSKFSFSLINQTSENYNSYFSLYGSSGKLKTAKLLTNLEWDTIYLSIEVRDHGNPTLSSTEQIQVKIIDVNNNPPQFTEKQYYAKVMENTVNTTVTTMKATDNDTSSVLQYYIEEPPSQDYFEIDKTTGKITVVKMIDKEAQKTPIYLFELSQEPPSQDYFEIDKTTGKITVVKMIDKEAQKTPFYLVIKAIDSGPNGQCECISTLTQNYTFTNLSVEILDQNDNPPIISSFIRVGVRRTVKQGERLLNLKEMVHDKDIDINNDHHFSFNGSFTYSDSKLSQQISDMNTTKRIKECPEEKFARPICLSGNGTLATNIYFEEDMNGYISMPVVVWDAGGYSTTIIRLDIISDYQTATLVLFGNKAYVESIKDKLMRELSEILDMKYNFTADSIRATVASAPSQISSTYLDFYVTDRNTEKILTAREVIKLFDDNADVIGQFREHYEIADVKEYTDTLTKTAEEGIKTTFILTGVIVLLGITVLLMVFCYCRSVSKYQLKLKSATTLSSVDHNADIKASHPGTNVYARNQNPLLNKEDEFNKVDYARYNHEDDLSVSSYDSNQFDKKEPARGEEEKGAIMDMYEEEVDMQDEIDGLAMALQQHKREKAASQESFVENSSHIGQIQPEFCQAFINEGFELHLETTEI